MRKKSVARLKRPKAFLGAAEAAATIASAGIQAAATYAAAEQQSEALQQQAEQQARALEKTNDNNTRLEEKNIEMQKQTSNKIADAITANQMNLQMIAGNESAKERAAEGRIMVKCGGIARRMRNGGYDPQYSLTGGGNLPFRVIDGGGVIPRGTTPEGYDLYEIYGDNHEHYHKAQGGKYKSGVGIRFANGGLVEGEGNQGGRQGEYLLVTPDNGYFISKHNINGINPAGLVNRGVNPVDAYNMQEMAKKGSKKFRAGEFLRTAGKYGCRVKKPWGGSQVNGWYHPDYYESDIMQQQANAAWRGIQNPVIDTYNYVDPNHEYYVWPHNYNKNTGNIQTPTVSIVANNVPREAPPALPSFNDNPLTEPVMPTPPPVYTGENEPKSNFWDSPRGALAINTAANFAGAGINYLGNLMGQHKLSSAYNNAARLMSNAYANLKEVDVNSLGLNDINQWRSAQYLPAIRSARFNVNPQLQDIARSELRQNEAVGNTTLSSAARNNRMQAIAQTAQENRSKVYADQANREEEIKQKNNQMINEAASRNIQASNQLRQSLASIRADLAKYNNDIANQRILGPAQVQSQMGINRASAKANAYSASGESFANALNTVGNNAFTAWQTQYNAEQDYRRAMAGADNNAAVRMLLLNDPGEKTLNDNLRTFKSMNDKKNFDIIRNAYGNRYNLISWA